MSHLFNDLVGFKGNAVDAFNRLKTSNAFTLFDSSHRYRENPYWDTVSITGGSYAHSANESVIDMTVDTQANAKVVRETKRVFPYQPGKSLLVLNTFVFNEAKENLRQRVGYFGTQNGIYLEQSGSDVYLVLRSYVGGSVDETRRIAQADWNGDNFLGNGPSGVTLDLTKGNIMWMDVEWLGVGDVRVGFISEGRPVVAHTFYNANLNSTTYMTTATLPLRYEIENLGITDSPSTMKQICSSVVSEGGYEGFTRKYNVTKNGTTATDLATAGTQYPMVALRLNSNRLDSVVVPSSLSVALDQLDNNKPAIIQWKFLLNPSLSGGSWVTHPNGNVDYNNTATSLTGGTELFGGYVSSNSTFDVSGINDFNFQLGRTQNGVSDVLVLAFVPTVSGTDAYGDLSWYEIT
jgi:hypothetical protein